jgi:hypothetical protein
MVYAFLISPMRATYSDHPIQVYFMRNTNHEAPHYKLLSSHLLHPC